MNVPKVFGDNDNVYGIEGGCDNVTELEHHTFSHHELSSRMMWIKISDAS